MKQKVAYGQFYSTNVEYLLDGHKLPANVKKVVEPFVGQGDILTWSELKNKHVIIEAYDVYPKYPKSVRRNTLKDPPNYKDRFVITNPPYLAMNHSKSKTIYHMYGEDDLYKCFFRSILNNTNQPDGGIVIVPVNFWSSVRPQDASLRADFLRTFHIQRLNIYEEQVFDDTSYAVCSFSFMKYPNPNRKTSFDVRTYIYQYGKVQKQMTLHFAEQLGWRIGGEIYQLPVHTRYVVTRNTNPNTYLHLYAIDSGSQKGRIHISFDPKLKFTDVTSRTHATLHIEPAISMSSQKRIAQAFSILFERYRKKYHSLFLTNYRESKEYARKRVPFELVYQIVGHLLLREKLS